MYNSDFQDHLLANSRYFVLIYETGQAIFARAATMPQLCQKLNSKAMKKLLISVSIAAFCMQFVPEACAQTGTQTVNGLKTENVWQLVEKALSDKGMAVDKFEPAQNKLITTYQEFTAMMVKNRARLQFTYSGALLAVSAVEKQYQSASGWTDAVIKGSQAEKQLITPLVERIKSILSDPVALSQAIENSGLIPSRQQSAPVQSALTTISNSVNQSGAKRTNIDRAVKLVADDLMDFSEGLAGVRKGEKWGFVDTTGKLVVPINLPWKSMTVPGPKFSCGLAMIPYDIRSEITVKYIDKNGKDVIVNPKYYSGSGFYEGIALILTVDGKFLFINTQGGILPPQPKVPAFGDVLDFKPFSEGLSPYLDRKAGMYGYINTKGGVAIDPVFENAEAFRDGLALVQKKTETGGIKWGFIDKTGKTVIDFAYTHKPSSFSEGLCMIENKEYKKGYINKEGNIILPVKYNYASDFQKGYAFVTEEGLGYYYVMDKEGKKIAELPEMRTFKLISPFADGVAVYDEGRAFSFGTITPEGIVRIPHKVEGQANIKVLQPFHSQRAVAEAQIGSTYYRGFVDYTGNFVLVLGSGEF